MYRFLKHIIPEKHHNSKIINIIKNKIILRNKNLSYAQEGEDLILKRIFETKATGFYVDIGAHHPKRFSNTYIFYRKGWRGINVDAMPGSMRKFNKIRPADINIECGISETESNLNYYAFEEPALNTFNKNQAELLRPTHKLKQTCTLRTQTLKSLLDKNLPAETKIDFMTIDVEGLDLEVLKSNNWTKYTPDYILVEIKSENISEIQQSEIYSFLSEKNYAFFAKTVNTVFFKRTSHEPAEL